MRLSHLVANLVLPAITLAAPFGLSVRDPQAFGDPAVDSPLLYRINMSSGAATLIGSLGLPGGDVEGLARNSAGAIYGIDENNNVLVTIDETSGAGTVIGGLGVDASDAGLAFSPSGMLFWADAFPTNLYTVDPTTGAATLVGDMGAPIDGLTFIGGVLYGLSSDNDAIYTIDTATAAATLVGPLGIFTDPLADGAIERFRNGTLYGIHDGGGLANGVIYTVNSATGAGTLGPATLTGFEGLVETVPEPSTVSAVALGMVAVLCIARRRRRA